MPDIREGYWSFSDFIDNQPEADDDARERAKFLDQHSAFAYVFSVSKQSARYHDRLMSDIDPDNNGALFRLMNDQGIADRDIFLRICDSFNECEGSRKKFIQSASAIMPELTPEFENWAALRYYTTPAEFESRFIRDFPSFVVDLLSDAGLAKPILLSEAQDAIPDKGPVRAAYGVPFLLPNDIPPEKLEKLGHIVLDVRRQVPRGSAKFASLAQEGFMQNAEDVNQVLQDALSSEYDVSAFLDNRLTKLGILGITTLVSFALSFVTTGTSDFASSMMLDAAVGYLADRTGAVATPFIQTSNQFKKKVERLV